MCVCVSVYLSCPEGFSFQAAHFQGLIHNIQKNMISVICLKFLIFKRSCQFYGLHLMLDEPFQSYTPDLPSPLSVTSPDAQQNRQPHFKSGFDDHNYMHFMNTDDIHFPKVR